MKKKEVPSRAFSKGLSFLLIEIRGRHEWLNWSRIKRRRRRKQILTASSSSSAISFVFTGGAAGAAFTACIFTILEKGKRRVNFFGNISPVSEIRHWKYYIIWIVLLFELFYYLKHFIIWSTLLEIFYYLKYFIIWSIFNFK